MLFKMEVFDQSLFENLPDGSAVLFDMLGDIAYTGTFAMDDLSAIGGVLFRDQLQQCRFTGTIGTDKPYAISREKRDRKILKKVVRTI